MQQHGFAYRFDWGFEGLQALAPISNVVIIVDVLRFTSAVCCALEVGATVLPFPWNYDQAGEYARLHKAICAGRREDGGPSLSPTDLLTLDPGTRIVLPSPNGSALAFAASEGNAHVLAGSLRNATATANAASNLGGHNGVISVIAAGERWHADDGPTRFAIEDLIGAGAILAALDPSAAVSAPRCSPEAAAARAGFLAHRPRLYEALTTCSSGRELIERGWADDVATSSAFDVSAVVARLFDSEFRAV